MNICAIILAGGVGSRIGGGIPKQKIEILGRSILWHTLEKFEKSELVDSVIVVSSGDEMEFAKRESLAFSKVKKVTVGGESRAESARNGFLAIDFPCDFVLVHDGARCLVKPSDIDAVINDAIKFGSATASTPISDTVKSVDENSDIVSTVSRSTLRGVQTPQAFKYELYKQALDLTEKLDETITDDNSLLEKIGVKVHCTSTSKNNIKITYKEDLDYARFLMTDGKDNDEN
jgi:2-C-methyl-D-erythritol 4-phosphate cytidylyltransferase